MLLDIIIARSSDGLLLCEVQNEKQVIPYETKREAKLYLRKGKSREEIDYQNIDVGNKSLKSLQSLKSSEGVSYMIFFEAAYNFKLACLFLDELKTGFTEEMKTKWGSNLPADQRSKLETIESNESYCFQSFERFIKKKRVDFQDVNSSKNEERLKQEITELSRILNDNIKLLLDRENDLSNMSNKARSLKEESKMFKDKSRDLVWSLWLKQNSVYLIIAAFVLIFLYLKFF